MDVVWLILDSLSYAETPFAEDGPDTMPGLRGLAAERGRVFTRAFSPGPSSPSSHGSLFTGELPSTTGMHEATPYYEGSFPTIAGALSDTHHSLLISTNPFLFNGIDREFDQTEELTSQQYMVFEEATDPKEYVMRMDHDSSLEEFVHFCLDNGKPLRSFVNGVSYKLWSWNQAAAIPRNIGDDERYQYATTMNRQIRTFLKGNPGDSLVVANYMDVHPPFDASDEALERFAAGKRRDDLPIGVSGQDVLELYQEGDEETAERMMKLYRATIWDLDRKLEPFVRDILNEGAFVVITADHGNWFRRREEFEDERIHVPLLVFNPEGEHERRPETVNIRDVPATTMEALGRENAFSGESLLSVSDHRRSITESIREVDASHPVNARGVGERDIAYDIAAIQGDNRIEYVDGEFRVIESDGKPSEELRRAIEDLVERGPAVGEAGDVDYDDATEQRLEDLGYL